MCIIQWLQHTRPMVQQSVASEIRRRPLKRLPCPDRSDDLFSLDWSGRHDQIPVSTGLVFSVLQPSLDSLDPGLYVASQIHCLICDAAAQIRILRKKVQQIEGLEVREAALDPQQLAKIAAKPLLESALALLEQGTPLPEVQALLAAAKEGECSRHAHALELVPLGKLRSHSDCT